MSIALIVHGGAGTWRPGSDDDALAGIRRAVEAGRAILRGLVTPERTTLIASTHRALAVSEKQAPGDGVLVVERSTCGGRGVREDEERVAGSDARGEPDILQLADCVASAGRGECRQLLGALVRPAADPGRQEGEEEVQY